MNENPVSHNECEIYRQKIYKKNNEQDNNIVEMQTTNKFLVKLASVMIGTMVTGFMGVIWSVLSTS